MSFSFGSESNALSTPLFRTNTVLTTGSGKNVGQTVVEKENVRDSEVPKAICELVDQIKLVLIYGLILRLIKNLYFRHMIEAIHEYDAAVSRYQDVIEDLHIKISEILNGKSLLTTADLKEHLMRFDTAFSTVASHLFESNQKVEELKMQLSADNSFFGGRDPFARRQEPLQSFSELRGRDSFPSQSTIVDLGKRLKPTQSAPAATDKGSV
uniref:Gamma-tubulin complex component n=1 Tax=Heterorhabditis bacteriophora TaxID=37862 RepID=A0A1I7WRX5_HETBA